MNYTVSVEAADVLMSRHVGPYLEGMEEPSAVHVEHDLEALAEVEAVARLFGGAGPARSQLRSVEWSSTPLGPVRGWSEGLRTAVHAVLDSSLWMCLEWGPELVTIGNDAVVALHGADSMQGKPARLALAEHWDALGPQLERVLRTGQGQHGEDVLSSIRRDGYIEETYTTYSHSALREQGRLAGVLSTSIETTARVLAERRLNTLHALSASALGGGSVRDVAERMLSAVCKNAHDVPFALLYLIEEPTSATLVAAAGVSVGSPLAPESVLLQDAHAAWPLGAAASDSACQPLDGLADRFPGFHVGPWPEAPGTALLLPLRASAQCEAPFGVLVLGINPRRVFDGAGRSFFELIAASVSGALCDARTRQRESERQNLGATEERYRALFESIHEGFCTIEVLFNERGDAYDYRFLETNPAFLRETGLDGVVGQTMRSLVPGHEVFWYKVYGRVASTGEPARFRHAAEELGKLYDVFAFRVGEPAQRRVAVLFHDVTETVSRLESGAPSNHG